MTFMNKLGRLHRIVFNRTLQAWGVGSRCTIFVLTVAAALVLFAAFYELVHTRAMASYYELRSLGHLTRVALDYALGTSIALGIACVMVAALIVWQAHFIVKDLLCANVPSKEQAAS